MRHANQRNSVGILIRLYFGGLYNGTNKSLRVLIAKVKIVGLLAKHNPGLATKLLHLYII